MQRMPPAWFCCSCSRSTHFEVQGKANSERRTSHKHRRMKIVDIGRCKQQKSVPSDARNVTYNGCPPAKHVGLPLAYGRDPAAEKMAHLISSQLSLAATHVQCSSNVHHTNIHVLTLPSVLDHRLEQHGGAGDTDKPTLPSILAILRMFSLGPAAVQRIVTRRGRTPAHLSMAL